MLINSQCHSGSFCLTSGKLQLMPLWHILEWKELATVTHSLITTHWQISGTDSGMGLPLKTIQKLYCLYLPGLALDTCRIPGVIQTVDFNLQHQIIAWQKSNLLYRTIESYNTIAYNRVNLSKKALLRIILLVPHLVILCTEYMFIDN